MEVGYSVREYSAEEVVGKVEVLEVWPRGEVERRRRRRREEVALEAEVSEMGELSQRLSRTGEVEILEEEPSDPMGSGVAGDAEPGGGTRVGRVEPGRERVGRV